MNKLNLQLNMDNLSPTERDTLLALVNKASKPKKWEGPQGNFVIGGDGSTNYWSTGPKEYRSTGHCGKTKEEAEYIRDQLTHYAWMIHAWVEVVGTWRPNWRAEDQHKFVGYEDTIDKKLNTDYHMGIKPPHGFYFPNEEAAKQWLEIVGDRIQKLGE